MKPSLLSLVLMAALCIGAQNPTGTLPPLVYSVENTLTDTPDTPMPDISELPVIHHLPDPLKGVTDFTDWARRRNEIGRLIQHYELGEKPTVLPDAVKARMEADTLFVTVSVEGRTLTLRSTIHYPETGQPPYALMIGTSGNSLPRQLFEGRPIALMTFHESQVNDYSHIRRQHHERGQHPFDYLYPHLLANGAYIEWAWGLSRLLDGLQQLGPEQTHIDMARIGVTGCSYAGKMALYCGAFDERVALTIAQEPGGGGAAAWRVSHTLENVEDLDHTDYHWFLQSMRDNFGGDRVYRLPFDQHELCAMVCPRALLLLGNPDWKWLADEAMQTSAEAARRVWQRFGISDRFDCSIVGGHPHCMLPESQYPIVQSFIDRFLLGVGQPSPEGALAVSSYPPTDSPQLEFVMQLVVTLGTSYSLGDTPRGQRTVVPITGGTFQGPKVRGTILPGGADYQLGNESSHRTELEAIYSIQTDDGVPIHVRNRGIIYSGKDETGAPSLYFKAAPQFEAPTDSPYAWLNNALFVCQPAPSKPGAVTLNVWKVK